MTTEAAFAGLYIHIPFCLKKCRYCDFYSASGRPDFNLQERYLAVLKKELSDYIPLLSKLETVFIGGGTPSLMEPALLGGLLSQIYDLSPNISEITIECNPDDVNIGLLNSYRNFGINRLSLGIQSLDDGELRFLGRRHSARQAEEAIIQGRQAGFSNISCDLITGLPGQTKSLQKERLESLLAFHPEHISCYQLTIAAGTPLDKAIKNREFRQLNDFRQLALLKNCASVLKKAGYLHYEISNYALDEAHQCRHNKIYWQHRPYLGIGPAAHSFNGRQRFWNQPSLENYLQNGPQPTVENLTPDQLHLEKISLAIRTAEGIEEELVLPDKVPMLINEGFLERRQGRLIATTRGLGVADYLPLLLCPTVPEEEESK